MAMQKECTADDTGESGASASLAMKEAVAPRAPLRRARLLMDILFFNSRSIVFCSFQSVVDVLESTMGSRTKKGEQVCGKRDRVQRVRGGLIIEMIMIWPTSFIG